MQRSNCVILGEMPVTSERGVLIRQEQVIQRVRKNVQLQVYNSKTFIADEWADLHRCSGRCEANQKQKLPLCPGQKCKDSKKTAEAEKWTIYKTQFPPYNVVHL